MTFRKCIKRKLCDIWSCVKRLGNWFSNRENIQFLANVFVIPTFIFTGAAFIYLLIQTGLLEDSINNANIQTGLLKGQINNANTQTGLLKDQIIEANKQTRLLRIQTIISNSLLIPQLGDRCMWNTSHGGENNSYLFLKTLEKEDDIPLLLKQAVSYQLKRVHDRYKNKDVRIIFLKKLLWVSRELPKIGREDENNPSLSNLIGHIQRGQWQERARSVYLLPFVDLEHDREQLRIKRKEVFDALMPLLGEDEWSLLVRKTALDTYINLTCFEPEKDNVFDFQAAIDHYNENDPDIVNTCKP